MSQVWRNERQREQRSGEKRRARARKRKNMPLRTCATCKAEFPGIGNAKYCSTACRPKYVPSPAVKAANTARSRNREHIKRVALSDITSEQEESMRRKARNCPLCGSRMTDALGQPNSKHLDHIIPVNIGGTHTHGNVRIICRTCNLKRPKDGSDYTGPVTLWAQGPSPVKRPRKKPGFNGPTCRKGLHPWIPENIEIRASGKRRCKACVRLAESAPRQTCQCGTEFAAPGRTLMCPDCVLAAVRTAASLRMADGLTWDEIAPMVGYASGTGIWYAVKRAGVTAPMPPRQAAPKQVRACACGSPAHRHGRCKACTAETAHRAVQLRRQGWTLQQIASELGYSSITSITNLMKSVTIVESKMGRPRQQYASL